MTADASGAGRVEPKGFHAGHGQRLFLAAQFLHFGQEGFFVEVRRCLQHLAAIDDVQNPNASMLRYSVSGSRPTIQ